MNNNIELKLKKARTKVVKKYLTRLAKEGWAQANLGWVPYPMLVELRQYRDKMMTDMRIKELQAKQQQLAKVGPATTGGEKK